MKSLNLTILFVIAVSFSGCYCNTCGANVYSDCCVGEPIIYQPACSIEGICQGRNIVYKEHVQRVRRMIAKQSYIDDGYDTYYVDSY